MRRILFVDDEPSVLQGLRRMLRSARSEWEMEFVQSGQEALECLAASRFDVVVTDMRMPGMDGSELLREVMRRWPATVRIVLSGQCDQQTVLKAVGPTHQLLSKPCDSETLKSMVTRACRLCDHLADEWQRRLVSQVLSVPSLPALYDELVAELESPEASIQRVGQIISRDVGMTAKVLQLVSSGFFGLPRRVFNPAQAAGLLGLDTIGLLVFSVKAFSPLKIDGYGDCPLEAAIRRGPAVALAAGAIAEAETNDPVLTADALLAGLLCEVGVLVLGQGLGRSYLELLWESRRRGIMPCEVEQRELNVTHADIGACLMAAWGAPKPIVEAIARHHCPNLSSDRTFSPLTAVHVAGAAQEREIADVLDVAGPIDADYLRRVGCADRLEAWREICRAANLEGVLK